MIPQAHFMAAFAPNIAARRASKMRIAPRHFMVAALLWYGSCALLSLFEQPYSSIFLLVAVFCYWVILLRPMREAPYALLLLATGPVEIAIFVAPLLFLLRAFLSRKVYIPAKPHGYLLLTFLLSVTASVILSWTLVEFRPLQTIFWIITFLVPLSLGFLGFRIDVDGESVVRYAIFLILLETVPIIAQIPAFLESGNHDLIVGTWMDADIVGFWAFALAAGAAVWYFHLQRGGGSRFLIIALSGSAMALLASGKTYSGSVAIAASAVMLFSRKSISMLIRGHLKAWLVLFMLAGGMLVVAAQYLNIRDTVGQWMEYQVTHSQKVEFLDRVFFRMGEYGYSHLLGVGPGMLGSRAANSVSADVLAKSEKHLPEFLMRTPEPESRVMAGLWTVDLMESIRWMSATLVFPFSGIGALKGELGWVGLLLFHALVLFRYWPERSRAVLGNPSTNIAFWIVCCAGLSTLVLGWFDTVWEMPKIIVFLGAFTISTIGRKQ